jgi:ADDB, N-terminal
MTLSLIVGPPNSGRAGAVRERLETGLGRDPVLVVPTLEDASRFERELCEQGGPVLGASILTFERLFEEVVRATGASTRPALTRAQRLHLVRRAIATTDLGVLARSGRRPGFARALAVLIEEFQASGLDPATVEHAAAESAEGSRYLIELTALYRAYVDLRDELGLGDSHAAAAEATAAVRAQPDAWGPRPVVFYGFDDMTVEQLELVAALGAVTDATVSVTFEDRAALEARARLRAELLERGGEIVEQRESDPANTSSGFLFHLERGFLVNGVKPAELDPGLVLMEAAGERGQAEQIGTEIARLIATGVDPDGIAVVLRQPDRHGPLYEAVLERFGIPVAVEARLPLHRTAVGRGLLALLRAEFGSRSADDLLAFLRTPGRAWPDQADWLERAIRRGRLRTAAEAVDAWRGRSLFELDELRGAEGASELLRTIARLARNVAEYPYDRQAPQPGRERRPPRQPHSRSSPRSPGSNTGPGRRWPVSRHSRSICGGDRATTASGSPAPTGSGHGGFATCSWPRFRRESSRATIPKSRWSPRTPARSWACRPEPSRRTRSATCSTSASPAPPSGSICAGGAATMRARPPLPPRCSTTCASSWLRRLRPPASQTRWTTRCGGARSPISP